MKWLQFHINEAKAKMDETINLHWPELSFLAKFNIDETITPELIIPISSCKAVGGNPQNAVEMAAGLLSVMMSVRILDDLQDRDKPHGLYNAVGPVRAFNYSYAFMTLGYKIFTDMHGEESWKRKIIDTFNEGSLVTLAGQDRDLQGINTNWNDYWKTAEMKTCYITATGAAMGAMSGTGEEKLIDACRVFGYHWGLALQILNDMEGVWDAEGETDLEKGKVTLPVLYAVNCDHKNRSDIENIVWQGKLADNAAFVKEILDNIEAKTYLVWAALQQRKLALEAIEICPDEEGKNAMTYALNGMFADVDDLINYQKPVQENVLFQQIPFQKKTAGELIGQKHGVNYKSAALGLRRSFRTNYN